LTAGEGEAALADDGLHAVGEALEIRLQAGDADRLADPLVCVFIGDVGAAQALGDVVPDGGREEKRVLRRIANQLADLTDGKLGDIAAPEQHRARRDVEEPRQRLG
jgi:hypothetical protein